MLHHANYAVAGAVTSLFFAASTVAALSLARLNSRPVLLAGLGLLPVGLVLAVAAMSAASLTLFLIAAVIGGTSFGAVLIASLAAANRLAPPETLAQVISSYFVFAYSGLAIPVIGVGVAADYVGDFRAVLGCSIVLAVLCAVSAAGMSGRARRLRAHIGAR
jgi:MFS family permease